ncbi:ribonucleotide-diphosphate reductase subunit alpha, partial [Listeria monocytogenes]|nr:ribonucleotide-diphosphate reductase subunit alpha [Listeria monocytogenes]
TDDMNAIGRGINSALQLSRIGGGVGITLSNLREAGAPIKGYEGAASGVMPVMKLFEDSFSYSNQLGQRQGAGVVYLNVFHPDIISFLSAKKENADEKIRVKTLSLGVIVPDKFYELTRKNEEMYLFSPYSVEKEYGVPFSYVDITKEYDNLVMNPRIRKTKIRARDLENEISKLQQESGYPYIINIDTANRSNPIDGKIIMSNLCSEILQVQAPSEINGKQEYEVLGTDISCNLGSTNIVNLMDSPDFGKSVRAMTRALTFVTDASDIDVVPSIQNGNALNHTIGLGAMGLHTYFAKNQMEYGSPESLEFTDLYF